jgi:hypothetical protein
MKKRKNNMNKYDKINEIYKQSILENLKGSAMRRKGKIGPGKAKGSSGPTEIMLKALEDIISSDNKDYKEEAENMKNSYKKKFSVNQGNWIFKTYKAIFNKAPGGY